MEKPMTRKEILLQAIASGETDNLPTPITREEILLKEIAEKPSGGGGGTDVALENTPIDFTNWESEVDV